MEWTSFWVLIGLIVIVLIFFMRTFRMVSQSDLYVIERFGQFKEIWDSGLHILWPFIDRIALKVSTKEKTLDSDPQPVITHDNLTISIDTFVFYRIVDARAYCYGVENAELAITALSTSALRNIIGNLELERCLTSRNAINQQITAELDDATDKWGIKILRVEVKNIVVPREIQQSMDRQMKADRERRETIILAEAEKSSKLLRAETEKTEQVMKAEGEKLAAALSAEADQITRVKRAETDKETERLRAEALKLSRILAAEAEAESIMMVQKAHADSLRMLSQAAPNEAVLKLKAFEALVESAKGNATTLIIPSELQGIVSAATAIKTGLAVK